MQVSGWCWGTQWRGLCSLLLWGHHTAGFQPRASAGALGGNPKSKDQTLVPEGGFRIPVSVNIGHWEPAAEGWEPPACGSEPLLLPADVWLLLPRVLLSTSPVETFPPRLLFLEGACDGLRSPGSLWKGLPALFPAEEGCARRCCGYHPAQAFILF